MKVLVLRSGAIGDIILTFPLVLHLIKKFGNDNVTFTAPGEMKDISFLCGIDNYVPLETAGLHKLYTSPFDSSDAHQIISEHGIVINLLGNDKSEIHRNLSIPGKQVYSLAPPADSMTMHAAEYLCSAYPNSIQDIKPVMIDPHRFSAAPIELEKTIHTSKPFIVIHPGTGSRYKRSSSALFENLIRKMNARYSVILITGPADEDLIPFCSHIGEAHGCILFNSLSLEQAAYLMYHSELYYGLDSGISHIAGLTSTETHVIFGPSDPEIWRPYSPFATVITNRDSCTKDKTDCRKCTERNCFPHSLL